MFLIAVLDGTLRRIVDYVTSPLGPVEDAGSYGGGA
jgi:hypothetical protein